MPEERSATPLVTIVTPSFNQGEFIAQTIESVLAQDYPSIEYIVMDGGSTDTTLSVLGEYTGRLRWVSERDDGQSDAIHRGFSMARGEIIAWLNADDVYTDGAISRAVDAMTGAPGAGFVYGQADFIDRAGVRTGRQAHWPWSYLQLLNTTNFIPQPATFFRRECYEAVGGLSIDLHYVMDYDLWIKLGQRFDVVAIPEVLALVRMYPDTKTASGGLPRMEEMRRMVARHGRSRLPVGHNWDFVRASVLAAKVAAADGRWGAAMGLTIRAIPYLLHPMAMASAARFFIRRFRGMLGLRQA